MEIKDTLTFEEVVDKCAEAKTISLSLSSWGNFLSEEDCRKMIEAKENSARNDLEDEDLDPSCDLSKREIEKLLEKYVPLAERNADVRLERNKKRNRKGITAKEVYQAIMESKGISESYDVECPDRLHILTDLCYAKKLLPCFVDNEKATDFLLLLERRVPSLRPYCSSYVVRLKDDNFGDPCFSITYFFPFNEETKKKLVEQGLVFSLRDQHVNMFYLRDEDGEALFGADFPQYQFMLLDGDWRNADDW